MHKNINFRVNDNCLNLSISDRLDTSNANEIEKDIAEILSSNTFNSIVLDLEKLDYISSAGLRVVLRLKKTCDDLHIINTNVEVYDIFDMTGFTEMMDIKKAYRHLSVDGCEVVGKGAKGTVYRLNSDTVIKVYNNPDSLSSIQKERDLARKAFVLGVPTAISFDIVKVGDKYGSVFELLDASSFSKLLDKNDENFENYVNIFADMLHNIHSTSVKATDMPSCKTTYVSKWIKACEENLPSEDYQKVKKLFDECIDQLKMLHFDYHTNNIMMQKDEALTIDMDTLCYGNPIYELGNLSFTYKVQGELCSVDALGFLDMKEDVYNKIWPIFLKRYLRTDDVNRINEVDKASELLGLIRFLRHTVHHKDLSIKENKDTLDTCTNKIHNLLNEVTTLNVL